MPAKNIPGDNYEPHISADGRYVAFRSSANLTGGNADGNFEIFLFDAGKNRFTQITKTASAVSYDPSISVDSTTVTGAPEVRIAFSSNANLTGRNADGNFEVFLYDSKKSGFTQVTNTAAGVTGTGTQVMSIEARISADGHTLAFTSNADLTGGN